MNARTAVTQITGVTLYEALAIANQKTIGDDLLDGLTYDELIAYLRYQELVVLTSSIGRFEIPSGVSGIYGYTDSESGLLYFSNFISGTGEKRPDDVKIVILPNGTESANKD